MSVKAHRFLIEVIKMQNRFKPVPGRNGFICKAIVYYKTITCNYCFAVEMISSVVINFLFFQDDHVPVS